MSILPDGCAHIGVLPIHVLVFIEFFYNTGAVIISASNNGHMINQGFVTNCGRILQ